MGRKKGRKSTKADEVYHVEVITKTRVPSPASNGDIPAWAAESNGFHEHFKEYYVKWAGYESDANSWEPEANLESCQRLLASFWEHIGVDDKDYKPGTILEAKPEWIAKEKGFFANEYKEAQERRDKEKRKTSKKGKGKSASVEPPHAKRIIMSDEESVEETPRKATPKERTSVSQGLKITIPGKKRKAVVTSSSSSDDEPLVSSMNSRPQNPTEKKSTSNEPIEISSSPKSPTSLFSGSEPSSPEISLAKSLPPPKKQPPKGIKMPRRSTNPQANLASMAPSQIAVTGGISTKQRIAQGALAPALPKEIAASSKNKPRPGPKKSVLGELSFKKRKISESEKVVLGGPAQKEPTLTFLNSPLVQSPIAGLFSPIASSSSITQPPQHFVNSRPPLPATPTIAPAMIFPPQASTEEVDSFLEDIMPPELAAPLIPAPEFPLAEVPVPKPLHAAKVPLPTRVSKEKLWRWTGPMYLDSASEPLCKVQIHNVTTEPSLRFSMMFDNIEKLELSSLYHAADIRSILSVFRTPTQMAHLSPLEENHEFSALRNQLQSMRKLFLVPMRLDNNDIGQIFCFPFLLHTYFNIDLPPSMNLKDGDMVMAILPYALDTEDLDKNLWTQPVDRTQHRLPYTYPRIPSGQALREHPYHYHLAISMLNFPMDLLDYVAHPVYKRPYTVWSGKEALLKHNERRGLEIKLLDFLLDHAKAQRASSRTNVRIIFIHVSALRSIQHLPEFVERRANYAFVQFYFFGTDPSIHPTLWGVKEVWPCGGIATFTPSTIAKDPQGACHLMSRLSRHPLWASYILPSALGMLATMECGTEDPLKAFDERTLRFDRVLQMIEDGEVALLEAPPERPAQQVDADARAEWVSENVAFLPPTRREALERGVVAARVLQAQQRTMEAELAENMARMHRHPAFMFTHRRYVVVCAESDGDRANSHADGFEWCTIEKFDFKDEYYPKQTVGGK